MASEDELKAEIERLKKENQDLQNLNSTDDLSLKIGQKGGLSLYGLGRFPVTLYKNQWLKLINYTDTIAAFIEVHNNELKGDLKLQDLKTLLNKSRDK
jgi:hypothetical protein